MNKQLSDLRLQIFSRLTLCTLIAACVSCTAASKNPSLAIAASALATTLLAIGSYYVRGHVSKAVRDLTPTSSVRDEIAAHFATQSDLVAQFIIGVRAHGRPLLEAEFRAIAQHINEIRPELLCS